MTRNPGEGVGTYAIQQGTLALSSNYDLSYVGTVFVVSRAAMTIMANDSSRAYGDANLVLTGTITGIKNGDGITATYSTTATAASPVGTYVIVPTAVDSNSSTLGNYDVAFVDGTLTITKAPLAVSAANERRLYGDTNSTLIGTLVGVVNGDDITATYSTSADAMSASVPIPSHRAWPTPTAGCRTMPSL